MGKKVKFKIPNAQGTDNSSMQQSRTKTQVPPIRRIKGVRVTKAEPDFRDDKVYMARMAREKRERDQKFENDKRESIERARAAQRDADNVKRWNKEASAKLMQTTAADVAKLRSNKK